jgi:hypothetical protein
MQQNMPIVQISYGNYLTTGYVTQRDPAMPPIRDAAGHDLRRIYRSRLRIACSPYRARAAPRDVAALPNAAVVLRFGAGVPGYGHHSPSLSAIATGRKSPL